MHVQIAGIGLACAWAFLAFWRFRKTKHAFGAFGTVGLALILYPATTAILSFAASARLLLVFTVLQAATSAELWSQALRILVRHVFWPVLGLVIAYRDAPWARRIVDRVRPDVVLRRDAAVGGLAVVPLMAGAQLVALLLLRGPASVLQTGDESAYFANATPLHVLALSGAPGLAEELYYRGFLLAALLLVLRPAWAIGVQAVVFAMAHAGFGTISHVLGPLLFAVFQGYLCMRVGLLAAMIVHAGTNLAFFAIDPGAQGPVVTLLAAALLFAGVAALACRWKWLLRRLWWRRGAGGAAARV